jgi:hypothetical protein
MYIKIQNLKGYCIIGDIHSSYDQLIQVVQKATDKGVTNFLFLGDLLDRGPKPNEVVEFIHRLPNKIVLIGNHDNKLLRYFQGNKVSLGHEPTKTLEALTDANKLLFQDIFKDEFYICYDPEQKIFISHAAAGRPYKLLNQIVRFNKEQVAYSDYDLAWLNKQDKVKIPKWIKALTQYGITNGDTENGGRPIRMPISNGENDTLDDYKYIFGHIHAANLYPESNKQVICIDYCAGEEGGKLCGLILDTMETIIQE